MLHTTTVGEGEPAYVFCHGLLGQGRNWSSIARGLAPAASLLVDLPGHGSSPRGEITYAAMADELADVLRGLEAPPTLVGHSMGGKVAMATALRHPDLVGRLCVVDIAPAAGEVRDFRAYVDEMLALDLDRVATRADASSELEQVAPDPVVRGFLLQNLRREGDRWRWAADLPGLREALPEIGGWEQTGTYDGPVLWVAGARSPYVKDEHVATMRALFPRTRLVRVKDAGHWVHADQPDVMVGLLRSLGEVSPRPPSR